MLPLVLIALAIWLYLALGRGSFWRSSVRDDQSAPAPVEWPRIVAVIPARDEADVISRCIGSLLAQDYQGSFSVLLIDDNSDDATAAIARATAERSGSRILLNVLQGEPLPAGWTGKLWAVKQGIDTAQKDAPDYLLLTDADIVYDRDVMSWLAAHAEEGGFVLTSLMAKLRAESLAERAFIPAFIYFFQMLYPFAWVNRRGDPTAAAAGGCMLVKAGALMRAGGIEAIRDALIDDCALAKVMKAHGPIWLGLTERVSSIRPSEGIGDIHRMVSRSAYAQLRYSPVLLALTILGMALTYWIAPLAALFGTGMTRLAGLAAWALMAATFWPVLRFYCLSPLWSFTLPAIATMYMLFTINSAIQHALGRGGRWKGRNQAKVHSSS